MKVQGLIALAALCCQHVAAQTYKVTTFSIPDPPKNYYSYGTGINDHGETVGYYEYFVHDARLLFGFQRQSDGTLQYPLLDPDDAGGSFTMPTCVDGQGTIAGYYFDINSQFHGFLLINGVYTKVDEDGPTGSTVINAINNHGDFGGGFGPDANRGTGFISVGGVVTDVNAPGATFTEVTGLALDGTATGTATVNGQYVGFLRGRDGRFRLFQIPKADPGHFPGTYPAAINGEAGEIVGFYADAAFIYHGFVYHYQPAGAFAADTASTTGSVGIDSIEVESIDGSSQTGYTEVRGVNASGVIVGSWQSYSQQKGAGPAIAFIGTPIKK